MTVRAMEDFQSWGVLGTLFLNGQTSQLQEDDCILFSLVETKIDG